MTGTLQEDLCALMIIFGWMLLRIRNCLEKIRRENQIIF